MYGTLANKIADHYRHDARAKRACDDVRDVLRAEHVEHDHHRSLDIRAAVAALTERERRCIHLTYWAGYAGSEVAQILDLTESTVWATLTRARRRLRGQLGSAS
ncbi:MAG: hypothetical protein CMH34_02390 [Microbacterium sp.]|nr:hypothetical protein [Microbacterium sp.]